MAARLSMAFLRMQAQDAGLLIGPLLTTRASDPTRPPGLGGKAAQERALPEGGHRPRPARRGDDGQRALWEQVPEGSCATAVALGGRTQMSPNKRDRV